MADSVVAFLLEHLSQLLESHAKLLFGVEDKVRSLHNELQLINVYLKTSSDANINDIQQTVLNQIRDVAHVAEDVIDTFVANVAMHKRKNMLGRIFHGVDHAKLLHDVTLKIDSIKTSLNEIHENKIKYDCDPSTSARDREEERTRLLHRLRRNVEEEDVVGFVRESEGVIDDLINGDSKRRVVSIIGMGGLGKTTLARKVYNSDEVKKHFDCHAWVYVSNECRARELLLALFNHFMPNHDRYNASNKKKGKKKKGVDHKSQDSSSLTDDELKKVVREWLTLKRYLIVLDDLWKKQDWDELKEAFPEGNRGSRILITSRLKEVASHTNSDPPHYLQFLNEEQSWELFSRKVMFKGEDEYPSELQPLGKQMVRSCGGLPLSIVVLAGLLVNKEKSHREWSKVVGHVNWYLTRDETQVKDIVLKLSYDNLPSRLKSCFLYLGIFPEDSEILVRRLLQLWVAEGFIQETGTRDPYDVAEDYLYELIDRSLIQVAGLKESGGVKTCRIHDLLRDLCISESKEDKVFHVCMANNLLIPVKPRRLFINCIMSQYISSNNNDHSCVRSLFSSDPNYFVANKEWKWLSKDFKLVRVLDLVGMCCRKIPSNLGNFIHLRYLRIDSSLTRSVPDSICNLHNLQTLDLGPSTVVTPMSFPYGILKLKHLRHVYTYGPIRLRGNRSEFDGEVMHNLQTISSIVLDKQIMSLIEKRKFPKLKKLRLHISSNVKCNVPKLLLSLHQLRHLIKLDICLGGYDNWSTRKMRHWSIRERNDLILTKRLEIGWNPKKVLESLEHLSHLSELKIYGAMDLATSPASFPHNITKLTLSGICWLNDDGMNAIGSLTKLRILILTGNHNFFSDPDSLFDINCAAGKFPQLQLFQMRDLPVKNWKLANGAMPRLQTLFVDNLKLLDSLPSELWSLTFLRKVIIKKPSNALVTMLRNLQVKNGCELIVERE